jgi:hypothetical protein
VSATPRRTVIVLLAVLAGAVVLVWSAASGPADMATVPVPADDSSSGPAVVTPEDQPEDEAGDEDGEAHDGTTTAAKLMDIASIAVLLAGLWVLSLLVRLVVARLPGRQLVLDLEPLPRPDAGHDAVQEREDRLREALTGSDVRNGIVACWALLEDAAADAGVPRAASETATELVVRFLHALDVDPRPVATLAALFQEARFSTHPLIEDHTRAARAALDDILRDVARAGSTAS